MVYLQVNYDCSNFNLWSIITEPVRSFWESLDGLRSCPLSIEVDHLQFHPICG